MPGRPALSALSRLCGVGMLLGLPLAWFLCLAFLVFSPAYALAFFLGGLS